MARLIGTCYLLQRKSLLLIESWREYPKITNIKFLKLDIDFPNLFPPNPKKKYKKIFKEIFEVQKKRIHGALLNSSSEEVVNFDKVLRKIING